MLKIGWASADVSTSAPVGITGQAYERISKGIMDPTTITVLYLGDGADYAVFISGDFTSIDGDLLCQVRDALKKQLPQLDGSKIIFNATHTHTAPRYNLNRGYDKAPKDRVELEKPEKYRAFLVQQITEAIYSAYSAAAPGSVSYGYGSAQVGLQRRVTYFTDRGAGNTAGNTFAVNGFGAMYGKTNDPEFSGYEGSIDCNVYLLFTFDEKENLTGAVVNVPCPSQCTETEEFTSADYWHETRQMIREKYGDIFILPQCAAAGDLSPHLLHNKEARKRQIRLRYGDLPKAKLFKKPIEYYNRLDIASKITRAFDEGYSWASREKQTQMPIKHVTKTIRLERWQVTKQQYDEAKENLAYLQTLPYQHTEDPYEDFKVNTRQSAELTRCENVIARYENTEETMPVEIHVVKLGDIAFTTCPYELYIDYQHRIQARSPFTQTFMVQLASSPGVNSGYLATARAAENKGYSAISYSCYTSPGGGQTLVEEMVATLQEIR